MNENDKQRIIERYNERLRKFGVGIDALASGSEERRKIRFQNLLDIGVRSGDHIIDLGCGFGDLLQYCRSENLEIRYTGIDINPNLIEAARKRFPDAEFRVADITADPMENADYVLSTSSFNLKLQHQDNYEFAERIMSSAYKLASKGVAIDFLTSYVDFKGNPEEAFYYEPEKVFSSAKRITKSVTLRHDYPLFEFCVYLFPDFAGWQQK
jgi:ubiquinone/menaquinone biosynthesis C-methylase UbiE